MIDIRPATDEDAAGLAELAERTFRDAFAGANNAEDMDLHCRKSYGESIQAAEIRDPNRATLVCDSGERLVGYGQLRWSSAPACVVATRPAEVQRIYVDAAWHGKGVAQSLMTALIEIASAGGADVAWLGVWERNPRAIAFYSKAGFSLVGSHVFVVGRDPQTDLILARRIG
jgi:ribosomal protein S18 acetylase RimI-like enzyme